MEIKAGILYKKGEGGPFKRKNWKRRYFKLTQHELQYYCPISSKQKGSVELNDCTIDAIETMPYDCIKTGNSASTKWRLAIQTPTRRFFISAGTEFEMEEWFDALTMVLQSLEKTRSSLTN